MTVQSRTDFSFVENTTDILLYTYKASNKIVSLVQLVDNKEITTTYTYDVYGNRTSVTDPVGSVTSYIYGEGNAFYNQPSTINYLLAASQNT